jgi:hypothetical protein
MRIVRFIDGFTSSSPPSVEGAFQEIFNLPNNQLLPLNIDGLVFNSIETRTVFINYEIERAHVLGGIPELFKQSGQMTAVFSESGWELLQDGFIPRPEILVDSIVNPCDVVVEIDNSTGAISVKTGNMLGTTYTGETRLLITRISL